MIVRGDMLESSHLLYLKLNHTTLYHNFCQHFVNQFRAHSLHNDEIEVLLSIKEKLSYLLYKSNIHNLAEYEFVADKLLEEVEELEGSRSSAEMAQYRALLAVLQDKRKYNMLVWVIREERKKITPHLHKVECADESVVDLQNLLNDMDYIELVRLNKYRTNSGTIQQEAGFHHDLDHVQQQIEVCYDTITQSLDKLRLQIYRIDKEAISTLRILRSQSEVAERNVELEIERSGSRVDYMLFAMRHWRAISAEIRQIFNKDSSMTTKMDSQIETMERYIEKLIKVSFVLVRQPDSINVMQTPSTQRVLREREFIKGSFLAYSPNTQYRWIDITGPCEIYLVGNNEYKPTEDVFNDFSRSRDKAYIGNLYEPSSRLLKSDSPNPQIQAFIGRDVCFPRVHMINHHLKRRCREINNSNHKRKHEDAVSSNAAPEEIFSFVLNFDIEYNLKATWHSFKEVQGDGVKKCTVQTCSKPVAILVHASQKPLAEGKLFWCRFNEKWFMPLYEVASVSHHTFKRNLKEFTYDHFGRQLSDRELEYLMSQVAMDPRHGHKLLAKSVLKDEAQYTDPPDKPPKRPSFWCWFYDLLIFLGKGKGKPSTKCNMESALKRHWREGRISLLSRLQAQEILQEMGPNSRCAIIRVSESQNRTLNLLTYGDSWGFGEKEVEGIDGKLRNNPDLISLIWSETETAWKRTDMVCAAQKAPDDQRYKRFGDSNICLSPAPQLNYGNSYPASPCLSVQGNNECNNERNYGNNERAAWGGGSGSARPQAGGLNNAGAGGLNNTGGYIPQNIFPPEQHFNFSPQHYTTPGPTTPTQAALSNNMVMLSLGSGGSMAGSHSPHMPGSHSPDTPPQQKPNFENFNQF